MLAKYFYIILFLNMFLTLGAEECSVCKKQIKENTSFIKSSSGVIFCSKSCADSKLPNCDVCGQKSKKYITMDDKTYCSRECGQKAGPHCKVCQKALFGTQYLKSENAFYCNQECYLQTTPKCVLCSEKSMAMSKIAGKDYCGKCAKLEKCNACGLPSKGSKIADEREICISCLLVGIKEDEKAQKIYLEVKKTLSEKFKIETTEDLPFRLIDKTEMAIIKGTASHAESGFYRQKESRSYKKTFDKTGKEKSKELVETTVDDRHIFVLTYLPENHLRNVISHELMHNWQMINYPKIDDHKIEEGLAEYLSYLLNIEDKDADLAKRKIENKDPVYGDGFRMVKEWDKGKGIEDVKAKLIELYGQPLGK